MERQSPLFRLFLHVAALLLAAIILLRLLPAGITGRLFRGGI